MNWFTAYLDAQEITLSNFASATPVWLQDISLLVPAAVLIITIINYFTHRDQHRRAASAHLSVTSVAFMFVFNPMMGGIALEAPIYQSMLWPPALIALVLTAQRDDRQRLVLTHPATGRHPRRGHDHRRGLRGTRSAADNRRRSAVVLIGVVVFTPKTTTATIITIATFLAGAQLLQNSRDDLVCTT